MKFKYRKKTTDGEFMDSILDTDVVFDANHLIAKDEEGNIKEEVLVLHLALMPLKTWKHIARYNSKNIQNGWDVREVTDYPKIELWDKGDIDRFLEMWPEKT